MRHFNIFNNLYTKISKQETPQLYLSLLFNWRSDGGFPATYHDKECTRLQCHEGAYRSFTEIFEMVKTQYPEYYFYQYCMDMKKLFNKYALTIFYCPDIQKVVIKRVSDMGYQYFKEVKPGFLAAFKRGTSELWGASYEGEDYLSINDIAILLKEELIPDEEYIRLTNTNKDENKIKTSKITSNFRYACRISRIAFRRIITWFFNGQKALYGSSKCH